MTGDSIFYTSADGLRLHYRDFAPAHDDGRLPVVCLSGLSRSSRDFAVLAEALATRSATPRRVLAFDYRGRGLSAHDADWRHYDLATEQADVLQVLDGLGITRAHFVGTSRGGLHAMALAATRRALIHAVVFNDIGPVLEPAGLLRIKGYLGKQVRPRSYAEAIKVLKLGGGQGFDGLSADEWLIFAETTFGTDEADLHLDYDLQLARTLDAFDVTKPLADSWALFDELRGAPVLTIRGANSDLLSPTTLAAMGTRWPGCETWVVPGQGHAPLLVDAPTLARIDTFLASADLSVTKTQG